MTQSLHNEFGIQGSVAVMSGNGGLPKVVLSHESGSRAEVYLHGGHVTGWTTPDGADLLFMSRGSLFAPGKPIRGGIPVCFPQFGGRGPLPQHGFARTSEWQLIRTELLDNGIVTADLQLTESADSLAIWPHPFALGLRVLLNEKALTVALQAQNTGAMPFNFQAALHTYFQVADIRQTRVHGLQGVTYMDALNDMAEVVEVPPAIRFEAETDRVYINAPDTLRIEDEGNGRRFAIGKRNLPDVVVWNPWIEKSRRIADFGDDEYLRMVCVETGSIETRPSLSPGERWEGDTVFSI